jgi:GntR family transcriptional regulator, transcriptional repressor for pyruvate dehydrogenase complex
MKKNDILQQLIQYVREQKFRKGDKFPPERELSGILGVSRTTLREAFRMLEERGLVITKRGSGVYIKRSAEEIDNDRLLVPQDEETLIKDQLEARFMIIPIIVSCATTRANENEIKELQNCIVRMSRAIVSKELHALAESENDFYRLLAVMTKNHKLVKTMEQLNTGSEMFWEYFIRNDEFVNNVIFAGYVEIVNAVKRKDPYEAGELAKRNIVNSCEWLSKIKNTMCGDIFGNKKN